MLNTATKIAVPFYVWPLAFVLGIAVAAGSLSYSPQGRINILWVWLLWAALPLLGSLVSLMFGLFGSARPWLFQWRAHSVSWYPSHGQRLQMLYLLQLVWCVMALGILAGYWVLLLFSDLAFGWSSTLITSGAVTSRWAEIVAAPWRALWPEAVPSAELVTATRYQRISPEAAHATLAGQWWRFLMASLIFYNLMPRVLLALVFYGRWHWLSRPDLEVRPSAPLQIKPLSRDDVTRQDTAAHWHDALSISWELEGAPTTASFGLQRWRDDEAKLAELLAQSPQRLLWWVSAVRSPVAELSDLILRARAAGVKEQALWPQQTDQTDPARHLASWRSFAQRHQLVWITDDRPDA